MRVSWSFCILLILTVSCKRENHACYVRSPVSESAGAFWADDRRAPVKFSSYRGSIGLIVESLNLNNRSFALLDGDIILQIGDCPVSDLKDSRTPPSNQVTVQHLISFWPHKLAEAGIKRLILVRNGQRFELKAPDFSATHILPADNTTREISEFKPYPDIEGSWRYATTDKCYKLNISDCGHYHCLTYDNSRATALPVFGKAAHFWFVKVNPVHWHYVLTADGGGSATVNVRKGNLTLIKNALPIAFHPGAFALSEGTTFERCDAFIETYGQVPGYASSLPTCDCPP